MTAAGPVPATPRLLLDRCVQAAHMPLLVGLGRAQGEAPAKPAQATVEVRRVSPTHYAAAGAAQRADAGAHAHGQLPCSWSSRTTPLRAGYVRTRGTGG